MNIKKYMKEHENKVKESIHLNPGEEEFKNLKRYHKERVEYLQHERLIHLLVTLAFAVFLMLALIIMVIKPGLWVLLITVLILILLIPYIFHYFYLENTVQNWYKIMDEIDRRLKKQGPR